MSLSKPVRAIGDSVSIDDSGYDSQTDVVLAGKPSADTGPDAPHHFLCKRPAGSFARVKKRLAKKKRDEKKCDEKSDPSKNKSGSDNKDGYESEAGGIKIDYGQVARIDKWIEVIKNIRAAQAIAEPVEEEKPTLLTLPCEIRLEILRYLLVTRAYNAGFVPHQIIVLSLDASVTRGMTLPAPFARWNNQGMVPNDLDVSITRVCKQLYYESRDVLYPENVFRALDPWTMRRFSAVIGFDYVRTVSMRGDQFNPAMCGLPPSCKTLILEGNMLGTCNDTCSGFHRKDRDCICKSVKHGTKLWIKRTMKRILQMMKAQSVTEIKFVKSADGLRSVHPNLQNFIRANF